MIYWRFVHFLSISRAATSPASLRRFVTIVVLCCAIGFSLTAGTLWTGPQGSGWRPFLPHDSLFAAITSTQQRNGHDTLEMRQTAFGSPAWFFEPVPGPLGFWGDLTSFSAWFLTESEGSNPGFALRLYAWDDPRTFWVSYRLNPATGTWQVTGNMLLLTPMIHPAGGTVPPPATIHDIPADAPVHGIHLWAPWPEREWTGFYDEVRLQFGQPDVGPGGDPASVPEPATFGVIGIALVAIAAWRRRGSFGKGAAPSPEWSRRVG
jgi:hypothetical protein